MSATTKPVEKGSKHNASKQTSHKRKNDVASHSPAGKKQRAERPSSAQAAHVVRGKANSDAKTGSTDKKFREKKNESLIQESVKQWEVMRVKSVSKQEKEELAHTVISQMSGKLLQLANHHTASRIIQFCAKWGTAKDRTVLLGEVKLNLVELAKSKYGHFLVRKLINSTSNKDPEGLMKLFKGHVAELLRHPYGADVVMDLYDVVSAGQRNVMASEFYGREFCLFDGVSGESSKLKSLQQALDRAPPAKRRAIIIFVMKSLVPIMEKALLHPPIVHRLLRDFLEAAPASAVEDAVDTLSATGGAVLKMVHTHEGAQAACMVLAYGSPKDRKRVLKGMKGYVMKLALDEWGHTVLCTALSVTDDTSLLLKIIIQECQAALEDLLASKSGRRVVLQLLAPDSTRYFPPHLLQMMHPAQRTAKGSSLSSAVDVEDGDEEVAGFELEGSDDEGEELLVQRKGGRGGAGSAGDDDVGEAGGSKQGRQQPGAGSSDGAADVKGSSSELRVLGVSKKDPALRRKELLGGGKAGLGLAVCGHCASNLGTMLREAGACDVVVEVCRGGADGLLQELVPAAVSRVQEALAAEVGRAREGGQGGGGEEESAGTSEEHVMVDYYGSRALRRLVLLSTDEGLGGQVAGQAVQAIWDGGLKGKCKEWVGSHAEKVLAALLSCGVEGVKAAVQKELKGAVKGDLELWAAKFVSAKGDKQ